MIHFLEISSLSCAQIDHLLDKAAYFKRTQTFPCYKGITLATLFYENSTRTRVSFDIAAQKLGLSVVTVNPAVSSEHKGEVLMDTVRTLAAMDVRLCVMRHAVNHMPHQAIACTNGRMQIINAGDGTHAHPSQALLDLMTILERKPDLARLRIAIAGDLRHSRVANSLQSLFARKKVKELRLIAPPCWQPHQVEYGKLTACLQEGIEDADVVICLRVQRERLLATEQMDEAAYHAAYGLTAKRLTWARPDALVMHPGPVNRGVEIDNDVMQSPQSVIFDQVHNGVFMRMAILDWLISEPVASV